MSFREKMARFMYGRYGYDQLCFFLLILSLVLMALSWFLGWIPVVGYLLRLGQLAAVVYCLFRVFSKDHYKRQRENLWYLQKSQVWRGWFSGVLARWQQRKNYKFFRCPSCHALLRVPRGKGRLLLTCRKCGNRFEKKT